MKREKNRIQENKDEETEAKDKKGKGEDKEEKCPPPSRNRTHNPQPPLLCDIRW